MNTNIEALLQQIGEFLDQNREMIIEESRAKASQYLATQSSNSLNGNTVVFFTGNTQESNHDPILNAVIETVDDYCKKAIDDLRAVRTTYVNSIEDELAKTYGKANFMDNIKKLDRAAYFIQDKTYDIADELKKTF